MAGKTVSAHVDAETAQRLANLARSESRSASRIAAEAIRFYTQLPSLAHDSLRRFQSYASAESYDLMMREIAREIAWAGFNGAIDALAPQLAERYEGRLNTDEEIEAEAIRLGKLAEDLRVRSQAGAKPQASMKRAERKVADTAERPPARRRR
jgi:predicted transcriptional regulator